MKKLFLFIVLIIVLALGGYFVYQYFTNPKFELEEKIEEPQVVTMELPAEFKHDKDRDGITDEEEEKLGTSDLETDTDGDGISDKLEIEKWKTDPTKIDTDEDGYTDFVEILNDYDPNGHGNLENN